MKSRAFWIAVLLSLLIHLGFGLFAYYVEPLKKSERIRVAIKFAEEIKEEKKKEVKVEEKKPKDLTPKKIQDTTPKAVKKEEEKPKVEPVKVPPPPATAKKVEEKREPPKEPAKAEPPKTAAKAKPPVPGSKVVRKSGKALAPGSTPKATGIPINTEFTQGGGGPGGGVEVPVGDGYYGDGTDDGGDLVLEGEVTAPSVSGDPAGSGPDEGLPVESAGGKGPGVGGAGPGGDGSGGGGGGGGARPVSKPKPKTETVAKVSKAAKVKKQVKVDYPDELRTLEIQGRVKLELVVDEQGKVIYVAVKQGLHPKLDEIAEKAAWKLEFEPAMKEDVAVKTTIPYTFTFVME